jgi:hypothetical protein
LSVLTGRENMDQGTHDLELSVRSARLAKDLGATTVGQLAQFTEDELLSARCFGETSLREIREKLAERGLRLGMSPSELRGRAGTQGKIVVQGDRASQTTAESDHEGPCCGHCEEAARKLRERPRTQKGAALRDKPR